MECSSLSRAIMALGTIVSPHLISISINLTSTRKACFLRVVNYMYRMLTKLISTMAVYNAMFLAIECRYMELSSVVYMSDTERMVHIFLRSLYFFSKSLYVHFSPSNFPLSFKSHFTCFFPYFLSINGR